MHKKHKFSSIFLQFYQKFTTLIQKLQKFANKKYREIYLDIFFFKGLIKH